MKTRNMLVFLIAVFLSISPATVFASSIDDGEESVSGNSAENPVVTEMDSVNESVQGQIAENVSAIMQQTESQNQQEYVSIDSAFATLKDNLVNGEAVSLTQAASNVEGFSFDYSAEYDVSRMALIGGIDLAQVNYDYNNIIATMQLSTDINLSEPQITAMELFDVTYEGVYEAVQLDDLSIDAMYDGLNVNDTLNGVKIEFANDFAVSIETGSFATIKDLLSIGDVFSLANGDLPVQSLQSMNYLTSLSAGQTTHNLSLAQQSGSINAGRLQSEIKGIAGFSNMMTDGGQEKQEQEIKEDEAEEKLNNITDNITGYIVDGFEQIPSLFSNVILSQQSNDSQRTTGTGIEKINLTSEEAERIMQNNAASLPENFITSDGKYYNNTQNTNYLLP